MFRPRLFSTLKNYSLSLFLSDLSAGMIVGIIAIPLAIAFVIASGLSPDKGLITAIIAGFLISALGGSNVQIGGPTGAFVVIVYGIVTKFGIDGLIMATIMAGIILIIMGIFRFGSVIKFLPHPVIVGFTSGIALIIFTSQINDLLGLGIANSPPDFIEKWISYFTNFTHINFWALGIGLGTVSVIMICQKINKRIPGALIALILFTALSFFLKVPAETIGDRFGKISSSFPLPASPMFSLEKIRLLIIPSVTIALLAGIESLLSAVVADGMIGNKHNSNTELIAQGIANIGSALFGGIPATGAIARTAANIKNGGKTPVAGIIHSLVILAVFIFLGSTASLIPLSCLAGILIIVSYNMSEWRTFKAILRCPKSDILVLLLTFTLTVIIDLTVAIQFGLFLALFLFMRRMNLVSRIKVFKGEFVDENEIDDPFGPSVLEIPKSVEVFEINGPFFFGAAEKFKEEMLSLENPPKIRILGMKNVPTIDATGIKLLEDICNDSKKERMTFILSHVRENVMKKLSRAGIIDLVGRDNIAGNIHEAVERSKIILGLHGPSLSEKIRRGGVHSLSGASDPYDVIIEAMKKIRFNPRTSLHSIRSSLIQREEMMFTGIGKGIAMPHPRNPMIHSPEEELVAICYLDNDIDYHGIDGKMCHTAIFVLSCSNKSHLETSSKIAKLCSGKDFPELLRQKAPEEELCRLIDNIKI